MNRTSYDFLDVLKGTIDDKVSTLDQTIYCKVVGVNEDYTLDVTIVPDEHTRVRNVVNASKYEFKMGDYGILYKIGNNLANAFIIAKLGPSYADNQPLSKQVADENVGNNNSGGTVVNNYYQITQTALNLVYPVGSIYMSVNNVSPQTFLGGTWERWGQGCVPVGVSANANDSDFGKVEQQGGERKHQLTKDEMPNHRHEGQYSHTNTYTDHAPRPTDPPSQSIEVYQGTREVEVQYNVVKDNVSTTTFHTNGSGPTNDIFYSEKVTSTYGVADEGGDISHNNLQPYITCYMWKRMA